MKQPRPSPKDYPMMTPSIGIPPINLERNVPGPRWKTRENPELTICLRIPSIGHNDQHGTTLGSDGDAFGGEAGAEGRGEDVLGRLRV